MALREMTKEEMSQLIDEGLILNEQGVPLLTRWMAKLFAANPQEMMGFLEREGFTVTPVTGGLKSQFVIESPLDKIVEEATGKKPKPKLLDPVGTEFADFVDFAYDLFVAGPVITIFGTGGALVGGGGGLAGGPAAPVTSAVGTALGGAIGTGVGGAASETLRQLTGQALGVNKKADLDAILSAGLIGAILPTIIQRIARFPIGLLRFSKKATKKSANIGRDLTARVAGSSEEEITTAAAQANPQIRALISESTDKPIVLLDRLRGRIRQLKSTQAEFPESIEISRLLENSRPIPVKGLLKILDQKGRLPIGDEKTALSRSREIASQVRAILGIQEEAVEQAIKTRKTKVPIGRGVKSVDTGRVDPVTGKPILETVRTGPTKRITVSGEPINLGTTVEPSGGALPSQRLQVLRGRFGRVDAPEARLPEPTMTAAQAQEIKTVIQSQIDFSGKPGEKLLNKIMKEAKGNLRLRIVASLPSSQARARYKVLNGRASFTDIGGKFHTGKGLVGKMEALNELDKRVGEHIKNSTPEAFLGNVTKPGRSQDRRLVEQFDREFGENFFQQGLQARLSEKFSRDAPKITTTGQIIGVGTGIAAGQELGGPAGAVVGGGAALEFFAPKGMLRVAQLGTNIERIALKGSRRNIKGIPVVPGIKQAGQVLRSVEPLMDFLQKRGVGPAISLSARERGTVGAIQEQATQQGTPQLGNVLQPQDPVQDLLDEVNAIPDITPEKLVEFQKRLDLLQQPQAATP